jgi:hypothetical protein
MSFLIWHLLAIISVMAGSFLIGFSVGKKHRKDDYV